MRPIELSQFLRCVVASAALVSLASTAAPKLEDPALQACLDRMLPAHGLEQRLSIHVFDQTGSIEESRASMLWKRGTDGHSRLLVRLTAPPMRDGIALLAIERADEDPDLFLYMPELKQTRRVSGQTFAGSMLGTDFSYEDFTEIHGLVAASDIKRRADGVLEGRKVYVVEIVPQLEGSAYSRIVNYIDQADCLPLRTEFEARAGGIQKELHVDLASIRTLAGRKLPYRVVMEDKRHGTHTELELDEVRIDPEIADSEFSPASLAR